MIRSRAIERGVQPEHRSGARRAKKAPVNLLMFLLLVFSTILEKGVGRKRTRMHDDTSTPDANLAEMIDTDDSPEEAYFRKTVFYVLIDNVVAGLTLGFNAVKRLSESFDFL